MAIEKKHTVLKVLLIITGLLLVGGVVFYFIKAGSSSTVNTADNNSVAAALIANAASGLTADDQPRLITYDNGYLNAWLQGLNSGLSMFYYNGKSYHTAGGTAVVS